MLKYLVTFGDSWPAGAELDDRTDSFPVMIARHLGVKSINLSRDATSADQALHRLLNNNLNIDWHNALVLFCLTGISRSMYIDRLPREIHPIDVSPVSVAYYKYIHSDKLDQFNRIKVILAAQQYCKQLGSQILFVNNWDETPEHVAIDHFLFYNKTLVKILNLGQKLDAIRLDWYKVSQHPYIYPNRSHPNIEGHKLIAAELSGWIKEKLNDKPVS